MSTEENSALFAKLVRGRVYFLRDKEFEYDEWKEISEEDRDWLEVHAVDQVTVEDEGETQARQKFVFEVRPRGESAPTKTSSPRSRTR